MSQPLPTVVTTTRQIPAGRRARQRADTRERLFQAALAEFRSRGVAGAQIDRIAKAAGVVRGTFYFHFPTKDDVLFELQQRTEQRVLTRVSELRHTQLPLIEVLHRTIDALEEAVRLIDGDDLTREVLSLYVRRPEAAKTGESSVADELGRQFSAAQQRGELRRDVSAEQLTVLFLTSMFGFFAQMKGEELRYALYALAGVISRGIRPTEAAPAAVGSSPTHN